MAASCAGGAEDGPVSDMAGRVLRTVEMHTAGEPVRIVVFGLPPIHGATLIEKRRYCREQLDKYRTLLMAEPRGHSDMFGVYLTQPDLPGAHAAAIFLHNEGYSTMCGHASLATIRYLAEEGRVVTREPQGDTQINIQCPCGLVKTWISQDNRVRFRSVPAFVQLSNIRLIVTEDITCRLDLSYGGAFYAFVRATEVGLEIGRSKSDDYLRLFHLVRDRMASSGIFVKHPESEDLSILHGVIFTDYPSLDDTSAPFPDVITQVTVFGDGQIDRSPCGSGTTACCALLHATGRLALNQTKTFRSIIGSEFRARVVEETRYHDLPSVLVEVSGQSFFTGRSEFLVEHNDPLANGFLVQ